MRMSDLVRGGSQAMALARKPTGPAVLSNLAGKEREGTSAPQIQDSILPTDSSAAGLRVSSQEASSGVTAVGQGGTASPPLPQTPEETEQVRQRVVEAVEAILRAVRARTLFNLSQAERAVEELLQSLQGSEALLLEFFSKGDLAPSPALESVNMCILALKIGLELGYPQEGLHQLGLAALLADIGKACLPAELLAENSSLSRAERASLRKYPEEGARLLQGVGPQYSRLAEILLQVHERIDGSGYPKGLKGGEIHEYAQILGLADIYESLVHERPFRARLGALQALKEIIGKERKGFADRILKALILTLSAFPVGSMVRLNTGEIGRVVAKNSNLPLRPVVEVLFSRGMKLQEPLVIDLSKHPLLHIQDSVLDEGATRDRA